ncbi:MAG TPA: IS4 family transposase [Ktedonobacteraceae bacterium]|jgi:hypothetical protein|nr:IS4 family transposase [Ktedonobacteraceae bacterium]
MTSSILQELRTDKGYQDVPLSVLEEIYPRELVCDVLQQTQSWEQRERRLPHLFLLYLLIAWTISPLQALKQTCAQIMSLPRWLGPQTPQPVPSSAALSKRRRHLGIAPLRLLMRLACQPLTQPETPGAFLFGRRLVAIDSKLFDVVDTPENDWVFRGRTRDGQPRCETPFPQVRLVSALEIGSHAHLGAVVAPGYRSEMSLVEGLLSFLSAQSLILQDSGFRGAWWIQRLLQQGHHSISRLQSNEHSCKGPRLHDGSYLVTVQRSAGKRLPQPLTLRIIEYRLQPEMAQALAQVQKSRLTPSQRPRLSADHVYRLATTLLDPVEAPAAQVAACYHERWELELVYDELQEHQQYAPRLLSKTSDHVIQELWALVLGHYAVRAWMMRSASQFPACDVDRLSFTHAICLLGTALTLSAALAQTPTSRWVPRLEQDLRQTDSLLPARRLRCYPRVVKASPTRFFVKGETDLPFVLTDRSLNWQDLIVPLHTSPPLCLSS